MTQSLNELFSLADRVALVTGGAGALGTMLARGLLIAGARVIISGRDRETGEAAVDSLSEFGRCEFVRAELATAADLHNLVSKVTDIAPDLNVLVNNAGITGSQTFGDWSETEFDEVMSLNVKVPFFLAQSLFPLLAKNACAVRPSHIVNIGSIAAMSTSSNSVIYGPSKAALHHLTKVLARKLGGDHIRVNAIAPGLFPSKMTAAIVDDAEKRNATVSRTLVGRMGEPDDLATLIIALVSNSYMTGNVIPLDGGLSI